MIRGVSRWLADKGNQFLRGGGPQQPMEPAYDPGTLAEGQYVMDPFNDGDKKYGGRQLYRSNAEREAEERQAQYQALQEQRQQAGAYQQGYHQYRPQQQAPQQEPVQQAGGYQQGYQQPQQQAPKQEPVQQAGGYQQGYQQPQQQAPKQEPVQQAGGYQQGYQQPQQQAPKQEPVQQAGGYQPGYQQPQQPSQYQGQQAGYQQPNYQQQASNVVTFPGMQSTPEGMVYAHVEYIMYLYKRDECRKVIERIRSNASVFLNMEAIEKIGDRQRCVDILSGAAYALGCKLNKLSNNGIYLISSPSVHVVLENDQAKANYGFARQSYGQESRQPMQDGQAAPSNTDYAQASSYPMDGEEERAVSGGFSSGSPTQRFQMQQGMSGSFGTFMAGSHTSVNRAIHPNYDGQN